MKSKTTALLLCFFLGGVGGHKFYLGQGGTGALYLIFCWTGVPCFLALIDLIMLACMNEADFNLRYNQGVMLLNALHNQGQPMPGAPYAPPAPAAPAPVVQITMPGAASQQVVGSASQFVPNNPEPANVCGECGAILKPGARFCSSCGAPVLPVPAHQEVITVDHTQHQPPHHEDVPPAPPAAAHHAEVHKKTVHYRCPKCHHELSDIDTVCPGCGVHLKPRAPKPLPAASLSKEPAGAAAQTAPNEVLCPSCGKHYSRDFKFCPFCGAAHPV